MDRNTSKPVCARVFHQLQQSVEAITRESVQGIASRVELASGNLFNEYRFPTLERAWCDAAYWLREALAEPLDSIAVAKLETALEVLLRTENTSGSLKRILTILDTFYGLSPDDPLTNGATTTARHFAKSIVRDRSRILHGTWSTLNSILASNRNGLENFVITVIRRAALELEDYALTASPKDNIDDFLAWVQRRKAACTTGPSINE